jgi:hypothetical protein
MPVIGKSFRQHSMRIAGDYLLQPHSSTLFCFIKTRSSIWG